MKVGCPHCSKILSVPDTHKGKRIRCAGCDSVLKATPLAVGKCPRPSQSKAESSNPPPAPPTKDEPAQAAEWRSHTPVVPLPQTNRGNFLTKAWHSCPVAFRTAFLATLGVIAALWLTWHLSGLPSRVRPPATATTPSVPEPPPDQFALIDSPESRLSPANVWALTVLYTSAKQLETFQQIRSLCATYAASEVRMRKATGRLLDETAHQLRTDTSTLSTLIMPSDPRLSSPSFHDVQRAQIDAMHAELNVMSSLAGLLERRELDSDFENTASRANDLTRTAYARLISLTVQLDADLANFVAHPPGYPSANPD